jgi:predicted DNA binding CopG/RHH family protein
MIRTNVFIPAAMLERLKKAKAKTGMPVSEFIRRAIEVALQGIKL